MQLILSIVGMAVLIAIAVLFSSNRRAIRLRTVGGAFLIQVAIGAFVLYSPAGRSVLQGMSDGVSKVIGYGQDGMSFIFGGLVSDKMFELFGGGGFIFAFRVLPIIVFFSSLIAVLYYLGIMQLVIKILGGGLQKVLGTSRTESLSATANIFVGQTEAPLVVRPYISTMTNSELFAIMCGGLASVAGSVLAGYAQMGVPMEYLIAASFMAAPGGLLFAKLMVPETEVAKDDVDAKDLVAEEDRPANIIDAAASGAASGMQLALNVGAMLLAFIALIALINGILSGVGGWFDYPQLSLELLLGWVFAPIAYLIGVPWSEATIAGSFIGQKVVVNEFVAFMNFGEYMKADADVIAAGKQVLSDHTKAIISFALCGFANLSSVAILLGGLGGMAPNRRSDVARLGMKAVMAGTLSNLMSATIAGFFLTLAAMTAM
ncbi:NupC/NupG family nucleoside CNT transporter [Providencia sp. PROV188]|jgi:CNT family concentrative nucleoside transporter|uniref:Nucleoside permease n=1 Tax=Providencia alcalifaciens TaxID=126385 RepID=A0A4R3NKQ1_9GAMM|nr:MULTISPECIES: NupC/NupG family nucleoside CNT transporter [Providencia]ETT01612.1 nucleoside transporter, NupC family [Providencia alcalifaciens PAL-3]EUC99727.1 nucleoside transporter, NupC family [Providencia alcalifaciens PAL-1]MBG5884075.1 NupC/NupG family nucleoside CNT transporter [Providencia alcalifaciens]MBS0923488.1 NupC/NupG family nucleoside CNT transporter [Providencia sp. JGM181]MBS0933692.1 NupC/NupG family nucleoside CNT transporter [Providencia sp. JGM172]